MTTVVLNVASNTGMTPDMFTVRTFTLENTEAQDGIVHTVLSRCVQNVIDDLRTSLLSGETLSEGSLEMQITMRRNDSPGVSINIQKQNNSKSESITSPS